MMDKSKKQNQLVRDWIIQEFLHYIVFLKDTRRARYVAATDEDALDAYQLVTKYENLNPSLEPCHAFAEAIKIAPKAKQGYNNNC